MLQKDYLYFLEHYSKNLFRVLSNDRYEIENLRECLKRPG